MKFLIIVVVIFSIGIVIGKNTASPKVDFVRMPAKTKIVKEPAPPPVVKTEWPEACADALDYAYEIEVYANKIYDSGTKQLDIISQGRVAVSGNGDMSAVENRQRALQGITVGALGSLEKAFAAYDLANQECKGEQ